MMNAARFLTLCKEFGAQPVLSSYQTAEESQFLYCDYGNQGLLAVDGPAAEHFFGQWDHDVRMCPLAEENLRVLSGYFPWLKPTSPAGHDLTIGFGDRLGVSSQAHLASIAGTGIFPVLAQQSIRELSLTGRSFSSMLADVAWQVFRCGYQGGYGADGDHLKTLDEVQKAISAGATMITLDCSENIDNQAATMSGSELVTACRASFSPAQLETWQKKYLNKFFYAGDLQIRFTLEELYRILLLYGKALPFIESVYREAIVPAAVPVAFEISIDETLTTTSPSAHYFVAAELMEKQVVFESMAPRFCGKFEKGIDYIGDLEQLDHEVSQHARIAAHFGYRLSVHSGSDKFSAFPVIGRHCGRRFHLKTSGTSWVEALRVIAMEDPALMRRLVRCGRDHFAGACAYYHVSGSPDNAPDETTVSDADLPALMDQVDFRQFMHITYGFMLQQRDQQGKFLYRDAIYNVLRSHSDTLDRVIVKHFQRHYAALGL